MPSLERGALYQKSTSRIDFVLKKLEDVSNLEDALLSGATPLSHASTVMISVSSMLTQVYHALVNADESNLDMADYRVQEWIAAVEKSCMFVEIAISDFLHKARETVTDVPVAVRSISTKPVNFLLLHNLGTEMSKIQSALREISTTEAIMDSIRNGTAQPVEVVPKSKIFDEMALFGYKVLQMSITQKLLDQSTDPECILVAILGPEGAGKTKLAQEIYESTEVKRHFNICFWFCHTTTVDSQCPAQLEPIDILRKMLAKIEPENSLDNNEEKQIISRIYESLKRKRYLVVIDNIHHYIVIKKVLPDENNGSRVLIITPEISNYERIALDIDPKFKYEVPLLTHEDSLKLLLRKSWHDIEYLEECSTDIWRRARDIATRWGESPMDLVLFGGHLLFNPSFINDIELLLDMDATARYSDVIISVYLYLPNVLKKCFACLAAVFPVNYIIHANSLIRLWIAEGIILKENEGKMEATANIYLNELIQRGLVRVIWVYYHNQADQPTRVVVLHPKLHNNFNYYIRTNNPFPVEAVLGQDAFQLFNYYGDTDDDDPANFNPLRRLAVHLPFQFNTFSSFEEGKLMRGFKYPSLHSLFFFGSVAPMMFYQFDFLRVLAIYQARIQFSEEDRACWLDGLVNLRYLGFIVCRIKSGSLGKKLPRFRNLQTLDLSESFVSGLSEYIEKNQKVTIVGPVNEESGRWWFPVPDMCQ